MFIVEQFLNENNHKVGNQNYPGSHQPWVISANILLSLLSYFSYKNWFFGIYYFITCSFHLTMQCWYMYLYNTIIDGCIEFHCIKIHDLYNKWFLICWHLVFFFTITKNTAINSPVANSFLRTNFYKNRWVKRYAKWTWKMKLPSKRPIPLSVSSKKV